MDKAKCLYMISSPYIHPLLMDKAKYWYMTSSPDIYPLLREFARENRAKATLGETILWEWLRQIPKPNHFRRQHIMGDYIADFCCIGRNLVIEVDGGYHAERQQAEYDKQRTEWLNKMNFQVLRFSNEQVIDHLQEVKQAIESVLYDDNE